MDPLSVRPLGKSVVVSVDRRRDSTSGGVLLPGIETVPERLGKRAGTVLAVGTSNVFAAAGIAPGDRVVFRYYLKDLYKLGLDADGKECCMIREEDLEAVIGADAVVGF